MKIQLGKFYLNKTAKFLWPVIKEYQGIMSIFNSLFKLAIGIGDIILTECKISLERHLVIIVDTNFTIYTDENEDRKVRSDYGVNFKESITLLRNHECFLMDYPYDDIDTGRIHVIVIKIPDQYHEAYAKYIEGKFSQMFTKEEKNLLFIDKKPLLVLNKDEKYKIEFVEGLNKEYGTKVDPYTFDGELEKPINEEEELVNYHLKD